VHLKLRSISGAIRLLRDDLFPFDHFFPDLVLIKNPLFEIVADQRVDFGREFSRDVIFVYCLWVLKHGADLRDQLVSNGLRQIRRREEAEPDLPACALDPGFLQRWQIRKGRVALRAD
jgi:hypothetical protein